MSYVIFGMILAACAYVAYKYGYDKGKSKVKVQYLDRILPVKVELPNGVEIWVEGGE